MTNRYLQRQFLQSTLAKCYKKVEEPRNYTSLEELFDIGYKCAITRERIRLDMVEYLKHNNLYASNAIAEQEVEKALEM